MIAKSPLSVAAEAREVTFSAAELRGGERFPHLCLIGARPRKGKIITAEGGESIAALPNEGDRAEHFCFNDYAYFLFTEQENLYTVPQSGGFRKSNANKIYKFIPYVLPSGEQFIFAFADTRVLIYFRNYVYNNGMETGGKCGTVHCERLFCASDYFLAYSHVNKPTSMNTETTLGAGHLDLYLTELGGVVDMLSWKDRIYVFRERGISVIRAYNDPTNYKITHLPVSYNDIRAFSAAICNEYVYFVADGGLFSFNGGLIRPVNEPNFERVDLSQSVRGYGYDGRYFAKVTRKDGVHCLYCYDPAEGTGYFFAEGADALLVDEKMFFVAGTQLYRATARGNYNTQAASRLITGSFALSESGKNCFFESVRIEGQGDFAVEIEAETGAKTRFSCTAGKRAFPPVPVRGRRFSVTVSWTDNNAEIEGVSIAYREVIK